MSKQITENAERVVTYVLENLDSERVTVWTWADLVDEIHGDTLSFNHQRNTSAICNSLKRHFNKVRDALRKENWDAIKLSFTPFRNGRKSNCVIPANRYDLDKWKEFLPCTHNRGAAIAFVGPECGYHPIQFLHKAKGYAIAHAHKRRTIADLHFAVERKQVPKQTALQMIYSLESDEPEKVLIADQS
jgi:hypothetical protein